MYVFPTLFIGNHSYGQVLLENPEFHYLTGADKSDPLNQRDIVGAKYWYTCVRLNENWGYRIEAGVTDL